MHEYSCLINTVSFICHKSFDALLYNVLYLGTCPTSISGSLFKVQAQQRLSGKRTTRVIITCGTQSETYGRGTARNCWKTCEGTYSDLRPDRPHG
jgi:hypothetical protein